MEEVSNYVEQLFYQFSLNYSDAFMFKSGVDVKKAWVEVLYGLTREQMLSGFNAWKDRVDTYVEFPPNPRQFKLLCLGESILPKPQTPKFYEPDPTPTNPNGAEWAAKALKLLRGGKK